MRCIIAAESKNEIIKVVGNVNYEPKGKRLNVNEEGFTSFWKSGLIDKFCACRGILIDDFETTIVDDDNDILILRAMIAEAFSGIFKSRLKRNLLMLADYACERKPGMVFFY